LGYYIKERNEKLLKLVDGLLKSRKNLRAEIKNLKGELETQDNYIRLEKEKRSDGLNYIEFDKLKSTKQLSTRILKIATESQILNWAKGGMVTYFTLKENNRKSIEDFYLFDQKILEEEIQNNLLVKVKKLETKVLPIAIDFPKFVPQPLKPLVDHMFQYNPYYPPCVYFLISDGEIVYVGKSENLPGRVNTHKSMGKNFSEVLYLPCKKNTVYEIETAFIRFLKPMYNNKENGGGDFDQNTIVREKDKMIIGKLLGPLKFDLIEKNNIK